jgi:hypothetical protein
MEIPAITHGWFAGTVGLPAVVGGGPGFRRGINRDPDFIARFDTASQIDFERREHSFLSVKNGSSYFNFKLIIDAPANEEESVIGTEIGKIETGAIGPVDIFHPSVVFIMIGLPVVRPPPGPSPIELDGPRHLRSNPFFGWDVP